LAEELEENIFQIEPGGELFCENSPLLATTRLKVPHDVCVDNDRTFQFRIVISVQHYREGDQGFQVKVLVFVSVKTFSFFRAIGNDD